MGRSKCKRQRSQAGLLNGPTAGREKGLKINVDKSKLMFDGYCMLDCMAGTFKNLSLVINMKQNMWM